MGRILVGAVLVAALALAALPLWEDSVLRALVPDAAYRDTYYVVVRFDAIIALLASGLLAGLALIAWERWHG